MTEWLWGELFVYSNHLHSRRLTRWLYQRHLAAKKRSREESQ